MTAQRALAAAAVCICLVASISHARAATGEGVAVVDMEFLILHSAAALNARTRIDEALAAHKRGFEAHLARIKADFEALKTERPRLSDEAYRRRVSDLRARAVADRAEAEKRVAKLDAAMQDAVRQVRRSIGEVVDQLVKERKLKLVLPRSAVVGTPKVPDITQTALARLNRTTPSVPINLSN